MPGNERVARVGKTALYSLMDSCRLARDRGAKVIGTDHVVLAIAQAPIMKDAMWQTAETLLNSVAMPAEPASGDLTLGTGSVTTQDVVAALREAHWSAFGISKPQDEVPQWSDEARNAVHTAVTIAAGGADEWADRGHLLKAVVEDTDSSARRLLRQCDVEPAALLAIAAEVLPSCGPPTPLVDYLRFVGVLAPRSRMGRSRVGRWLLRFTSWSLRVATHQASDVLAALEVEAVRQTVRVGHKQVTSAHLVLAVLSFDEQMAFDGGELPDGQALANASCLNALNITLQAATLLMADMPEGDGLPAARPESRRALLTSSGNPTWSSEASLAADTTRASANRDRLSAGSNHLLVAALRDPTGRAASLLRALAVEPSTVVDCAEHQLHLRRSQSRSS